MLSLIHGEGGGMDTLPTDHAKPASAIISSTPVAALLNDFAFRSLPLRAGNALVIAIRKMIVTVEHVTTVSLCDNVLGALLTVSEMAICRMAKSPVEIALAGRDNFGTAVTLALMLLLRRAPLRHRFSPRNFF
jgi:hypothetical protein